MNHATTSLMSETELQLEVLAAEERLEATRLACYELELECKLLQIKYANQQLLCREKERLDWEAAYTLESARIEAQARVFAAKAAAVTASLSRDLTEAGDSNIQNTINVITAMFINQSKQLVGLNLRTGSRKRARA